MSKKEKIVFITSPDNKDVMEANAHRYIDLYPNISVYIYYTKSYIALSTVVTDAHMIVSPDASDDIHNTNFGFGKVCWDLFNFFSRSLTLLSDPDAKQTKDTNIRKHVFNINMPGNMSKDDQAALYHETLLMLKLYGDVFTDILCEERQRTLRKTVYDEFQKRKAEKLAGSDTIDQSILDARYREAWIWVNGQSGVYGSSNSVLSNPSDDYSLLDITRRASGKDELTANENRILAKIRKVQDKYFIDTKQLIELLEKSIRKQ